VEFVLRAPGNSRLASLVLIGLVAGLFSAVFGVGGGILVVPALIAIGFGVKRAAGTSLGVIAITALAGAVLFAFRGEVHVGYALLVGLPASVGVVAGVAVQRRLTGDALTLAFAALLAAIGVWLIVA
jgi:uncharacterized membrane protein YfcA